jgi:hypothetical protein
MAAAAKISPLWVLRERAEARAILFYKWDEYASFEEATADLFKWALAKGLTDRIGAAGVFDTVVEAFLKVHADG